MRFYKDNHAQVIASKWNHFKVEKTRKIKLNGFKISKLEGKDLAISQKLDIIRKNRFTFKLLI